MTPVKFKFLYPNGEPIVGEVFLVSLHRAAYHQLEDGMVYPEVIETVTDEQGMATLNLFPANQPYYVSMDLRDGSDNGCSAMLRFRIAVPDTATELWADDLIVTDPVFSQAWDAEAIEVIMNAKAAAAASASEAKASQLAAAASEQTAAGYVDAVSASAAAAAQSASESATSATAALASQAAAQASQTAAQLSETAAKASETAAGQSATASAASAAAALVSQNEASASATSATNSANAAEVSKNAASASQVAAAASETNAAASQVAAATSEGHAELAKVAAEAARDRAEQAANALVGVISDLGPVDLSGGVYPTKPNNSSFWKVTVGGTVDGIQYGVGDTLMYTEPTDEFYKIDNTEAVTSVAGKTGAITLVKADVGLSLVDNTSDANKPISTATQAALDAKQPLNTRLTSLAGLVLAVNDILIADSTTTLAKLATGAAGRVILTHAAPTDTLTYIGGEPAVAAGTTAQFYRGDKTWASVSTTVLNTALTGFVASNAVVVATDTVLQAFNKLQGQISGLGTAAKGTLLPTTTTSGDGYVMRTGDGGVLGAPLNATDANACTMIGARYRLTSPFTNCPTTAAYLIEVCQYDSEITQVAKLQGGTTSRMYARQKYGGTTWGAWGELLIAGSGPLAAGGVLEIGQFLDFHYAGSSVDYSSRISMAAANELEITTQSNTGVVRVYAASINMVCGEADYRYSFRSGRLDALNQPGNAYQPFIARATSYSFTGATGTVLATLDSSGNFTTNGHLYANYWHFSSTSGGRIAMATSHGLEFQWNNGFYYRIDGNAYVLINSSASDRSVKDVEHQVTVEEAGAVVDRLASLAVSFSYKQNAPLQLPAGSRYGWVAQEAVEVVPTLFKETGVPDGEEDSTILTYTEDAQFQMIAVLMKTVSELRERVTALENQLNQKVS